jgi:hypothetical protein
VTTIGGGSARDGIDPRRAGPRQPTGEEQLADEQAATLDKLARKGSALDDLDKGQLRAIIDAAGRGRGSRQNRERAEQLLGRR